MNHKLVIVVCFSWFFLLSWEQAGAQPPEPELTKKEINVTIDSINTKLRENYVFPEVADKMAEQLLTNLKGGKYSSLATPSDFARQLTKDLQSVSKDKHLRVVYDPQAIASERRTTVEERALREEQLIMEMKRNNFGFLELKILEGNIGYLDIREFRDPLYAGETAIAAMNFFSSADALIIDLRRNGGGSPAMIQLITSYFFTAEPVHLNSFYFRPTNENTQTWTLPYVPGVRRPDIPLYLLTSKETFSAAEEFCYNLKNLKRATLIGETTGGGAHPTGSVIVSDKFFVRIPKGRAINPITKTNWEGTGVTPDIAVSADKALETALGKALEKLKGDKVD
jgi:retinol-binding protein 3